MNIKAIMCLSFVAMFFLFPDVWFVYSVQEPVSSQTESAVYDAREHLDEQSPYAGALDAVKRMETLFREYRDEKKTDLNKEEKKENDNIIKEIGSILDIPHMAKEALAIKWVELGDNERSPYVKLMTRLIEKIAYPQCHDSFSQAVITYKGPAEGDGERAVVATEMALQKDNIVLNVDFILHIKAGRWRICDVRTDGDSLVLDYKNQFSYIVQEKGFKGLIQLMEKKLKEVS